MGTSMRGGEERMLAKIVLILLCLPGSIVAFINAIRDEPPFTIMEKKEKLDKKTREKIETILDKMKKD
jgi:hypothetical protein